jgi:hypothetical protein
MAGGKGVSVRWLVYRLERSGEKNFKKANKLTSHFKNCIVKNGVFCLEKCFLITCDCNRPVSVSFFWIVGRDQWGDILAQLDWDFLTKKQNQKLFSFIKEQNLDKGAESFCHCFEPEKRGLNA